MQTSGNVEFNTDLFVQKSATLWFISATIYSLTNEIFFMIIQKEFITEFGTIFLR